MKVRVCFEKTEAGRYLSHLDLARTIERSLRRAGAPLAFSEGFHPHIRMSFASALAVGTTGSREYFDVELAGRVPIGDFSRALAEAFPPALALVAAAETEEGGRSLSAMVNLAVYRIEAPVMADDEEKVRTGIAAVLAADRLWRKPIEKPGKKKIPPKEVRGLIRRLEIIEDTAPGATRPASADRDAAKLLRAGDGVQARCQGEGTSDLCASADGVWGRAPLKIELELILRQDGQLRPQELWEMIGEAGGFTPPRLTAVNRRELLILQDGKTFSPMEGGGG